MKEKAIFSDSAGLQPTTTPALAISPAREEEQSQFVFIQQGKATNALTKIDERRITPANVDTFTQDLTVTYGDLTLQIINYGREVAKIRTSAWQLFDILTMCATKHNARKVTLSLQAYMDARGLTDRKEAKKAVAVDMHTLKRISIDWLITHGGQLQRTGFINIADAGEIKRNGDIHFAFGATFYEVHLSEYKVMPCHRGILKVRNKRNPYTYYLWRKITEHRNMNSGKPNENIIAVKTLLSVCPGMPDIDTVREDSRAPGRKIIEPFERDLDAAAEAFSWHYCHSNNESLTDEEVAAMPFDVWQNLLVYITWHDYPAAPAESAKKKKRKRAAKKKKAE